MFNYEIEEVHWELTNHCNLKCVHCYLAEDPRRELKTDEIIRIIDELDQLGCLALTLSGGEPLLRRDFSEIYKYAHGKGFIMNVFTNGTRITNEIIELFKKYPPFNLEITLNGITAETFEKVTAIPGSFDICMDGIRQINQAGIRLVLKTNGMTINAHEIFRVKQFARSLSNVNYKFDTALMPRRDHDMYPTTLRLRPDQIIQLYEDDLEMKKQIQEACQTVSTSSVNPGQAFTCNASKTRFHISAWGDLHPCHTVRPIKASLLEHGFAQAMKIVRETVASTRISEKSKCHSCGIYDKCNSCAGLSHLENKNQLMMPAEYHCDVAHEVVKTYG